jgi:hypothetical protein
MIRWFSEEETAMRYGAIKKLKGEEFRRLTGVQRETFDAMARLLKEAKKAQKARGGNPNGLIIEDQLLMTLGYWREYRTYFHLFSPRPNLWQERKPSLSDHHMVRKHTGQEQGVSAARAQSGCSQRTAI